MSAVVDALARALRDLFSLRVLWVVIWPMLAAALLWLVLGVSFWGTFSGWIAQGLDTIGIQAWLAELEPVWIAHGIQLLVHLMLFVPVVLLTALVITALFAMPTLCAWSPNATTPVWNASGAADWSAAWEMR